MLIFYHRTEEWLALLRHALTVRLHDSLHSVVDVDESIVCQQSDTSIILSRKNVDIDVSINYFILCVNVR